MNAFGLPSSEENNDVIGPIVVNTASYSYNNSGLLFSRNVEYQKQKT